MTADETLPVTEFPVQVIFGEVERDVARLRQWFLAEEQTEVEDVSNVILQAVGVPEGACFLRRTGLPVPHASAEGDVDVSREGWMRVLLETEEKYKNVGFIGDSALLQMEVLTRDCMANGSSAYFRYSGSEGVHVSGQSGSREQTSQPSPTTRCSRRMNVEGVVDSPYGRVNFFWMARRLSSMLLVIMAIFNLDTSELRRKVMTNDHNWPVINFSRRQRRANQNSTTWRNSLSGSKTVSAYAWRFLRLKTLSCCRLAGCLAILGMLGSIPIVRGEGHVIEKFVHSPGMHFEPIGKLSLSNRLWTVAATLELTPLASRAEQVEKELLTAKVLCMKAKGNGKNLQLIIEQWQEDFREIGSYVRGLLGLEQMTKGRRGLINGIGTVAKSLFGTMDAEDAQEINDRLSHLEKGQEGYFRTSGRQIEIINSTIFQLETAERNIQQNEYMLRDTLREANRRIDEGAERAALRADMDEHFMLVEALMKGVIRDVERIKKLIAGGKPLDTGVLSEVQLIAILGRAQLPKGLSFPVEPRSPTIHTLEEISECSVHQFGNKLVVLLKIPLVTYETFDVFAVYGIPQRSADGVYSYLQTGSELLVMHGATQYVSVTREQLEKCQRLLGQYLCTEVLPIQAVRAYSPCEVQMFLHPAVVPEVCEMKHVNLQHLTLIQLRSSNTWAYVAPKDEEITVRCGTTEKREILQDSGLLHVNDFCEVQTTDFTIKGRETSEVQFDLHVHPKINLTLSEADSKMLQGLPRVNSTIELKNVVRNMDELKGLQYQLDLERKHLERADQEFNYKEFFTRPTTLYSGTTLLIILAIAFAAICWFCCPSRAKTLRRGPASIEDDRF